MDFSLSEDQKLLGETVAKYVMDELEFEKRQAILAAGDEGFQAAMDAMAELGLQTLLLPESVGGFGGSSYDMMIVAEELGKGLAPMPILPLAALSAVLVSKDSALAEQVAGGARIMPALHERGLRHQLSDFGVLYHDGKVTGSKTLVPGASIAEGFLVATKAGVVHVASSEAISIDRYVLQDGSLSGDVHFQDAEGRLVEGVDLDAAVDSYMAAASAYTVGAMTKASELTKEYLMVRKQFGRPLASFQVLNFRMVDLFTAADDAKSLAIHAALGVADDDANFRAQAVAGAKGKIGKLASFVGEDSVQMHGGMGVTIEYPIGWFMKYFNTFNLTFGDPDWQLNRYAALIDWEDVCL